MHAHSLRTVSSHTSKWPDMPGKLDYPAGGYSHQYGGVGIPYTYPGSPGTMLGSPGLTDRSGMYSYGTHSAELGGYGHRQAQAGFYSGGVGLGFQTPYQSRYIANRLGTRSNMIPGLMGAGLGLAGLGMSLGLGMRAGTLTGAGAVMGNESGLWRSRSKAGLRAHYGLLERERQMNYALGKEIDRTDLRAQFFERQNMTHSHEDQHRLSQVSAPNLPASLCSTDPPIS